MALPGEGQLRQMPLVALDAVKLFFAAVLGWIKKLELQPIAITAESLKGMAIGVVGLGTRMIGAGATFAMANADKVSKEVGEVGVFAVMCFVLGRVVRRIGDKSLLKGSGGSKEKDLDLRGGRLLGLILVAMPIAFHLLGSNGSKNGGGDENLLFLAVGGKLVWDSFCFFLGALEASANERTGVLIASYANDIKGKFLEAKIKGQNMDMLAQQQGQQQGHHRNQQQQLYTNGQR